MFQMFPVGEPQSNSHIPIKKSKSPVANLLLEEQLTLKLAWGLRITC